MVGIHAGLGILQSTMQLSTSASSAGISNSGISTTPHFTRAEFYAHGFEGTSDGFVYKIDADRLSEFDVDSYIVAAYVHGPDLSIPEDDEIILVTRDREALPGPLIVEMVPVQARK